MVTRPLLALAIAAAALTSAPAGADPAPPEGPSLTGSPPTLRVVRDGQVRVEQPAVRVTTPAGDAAATSIEAQHDRADGLEATLGTSTTAGEAGPDLVLTATTDAEGTTTVEVAAADPATVITAVAVDFAAGPDDHFWGLGARADTIDHRGAAEVLNRVSDGPWTPTQASIVGQFVPAAGFSDRPDATYFPVPWTLSSTGVGVLVTNDETSRFAFPPPGGAGVWTARVDADRLAYEVFDAPTPADALAAMTARVGRQPAAPAPFVFGPWWQAERDEAAELAALAAAGTPLSVVQTYTHYLPCGDDAGREAEERARVDALHAAGFAVTTYVNPMVCVGYRDVYDAAAAAGAFTMAPDGTPYRYHYSTNSTFDVAQFDFTAPAGVEAFGGVLDRVLAAGYDGWMEDFGEYTPDDAVSADGTPGATMHNRYPERYHQAAADYAAAADRPLARYQRSGWTDAIPAAAIVWGGDPSAAWGFDGLSSQVRIGLGMGLSGISRWGTDIGGFFSTDDGEGPPTADLARRWIQFGAFNGVMRLQAGGIDLGGGPPVEVGDPSVQPTWDRYSRLRTRLYPYVAGADEQYLTSGLPIMRHLALAFPHDPDAATRDDEYLFGADLLVAPVVGPAPTRSVYLPPGEWVDVWSSLTLGPDGEITPGAAVAAPAGSSEVTLGDDIPLYVRRGAVLPLLPADVTTLADHGAGSVIRLADREDERTLVAVPGDDWSGSLGPGETMRARRAGARWTLRLDATRTRTYQLLVIGTPAAPTCSVTVDDAPVPFDADAATGAVTATFDAAPTATVVVTACD